MSNTNRDLAYSSKCEMRVFEIQTRDILESLIIAWGFHDIWNNQDRGIEVLWSLADNTYQDCDYYGYHKHQI